MIVIFIPDLDIYVYKHTNHCGISLSMALTMEWDKMNKYLQVLDLYCTSISFVNFPETSRICPVFSSRMKVTQGLRPFATSRI